MKSPFSETTRAWIYVVSLVISAAAAVVGPLSLALHWGDEWAALAVTLVGVLGTITNTLAKANLPSADTVVPAAATARRAEPEDQPQTIADHQTPAVASAPVSVEPGTPTFAA